MLSAPPGLCPVAHLSNGSADMVCVRHCGRLNFLRFLLRIARSGNHLQLPFVDHLRCTELIATITYVLFMEISQSSCTSISVCFCLNLPPTLKTNTYTERNEKEKCVCVRVYMCVRECVCMYLLSFLDFTLPAFGFLAFC